MKVIGHLVHQEGERQGMVKATKESFVYVMI